MLGIDFAAMLGQTALRRNSLLAPCGSDSIEQTPAGASTIAIAIASSEPTISAAPVRQPRFVEPPHKPLGAEREDDSAGGEQHHQRAGRGQCHPESRVRSRSAMRATRD